MEYAFALNQRLLAVEKAAYEVHKEDEGECGSSRLNRFLFSTNLFVNLDYCQDGSTLSAVMIDWANAETSRPLKSSVQAVAEALESSLSAQEIWVIVDETNQLLRSPPREPFNHIFRLSALSRQLEHRYMNGHYTQMWPR